MLEETQEKQKFDLSHARHESAHCLTPGLFKSIPKGQREKLKLDVKYTYSDGEEVRFVGFEPLGADDLRILQGLVALSGPSGTLLKPDTEEEMPKKLRELLNPKHQGIYQNALAINGSFRKILAEIGLSPSGDNIVSLKKSLVRMSNVTVIIKNHSKIESYHLMSFALDEKTQNFHVALNPRLTQAILGTRSHARVDMDEVRHIKSDVTRLIHQRLCGWVWPGKKVKIELDTLCSYAWPEEAKPDTQRKRRQYAKNAVMELKALGWVVEEYSNNKYEITRSSKLAHEMVRSINHATE